MLDKLRRSMFPVSLSRALAIASKIHGPDSQTPRWYSTPVKQFISRYGDIPITALSADQVDDWYRFVRSNGYSPYTVDSYVRALKAFLNRMRDMGHLGDGPTVADHLRLRKLPKATPKGINLNDAKRILELARADVRDWALVGTLYDSGCRLGELVSMQADKTKVTDKGVKALVWGKTGSRYIMAGQETAFAMKLYIPSRPDKAAPDLWLSKRTSEPLTANGVYQILSRLAAKADLKGERFNPHAFRHAAAKRWLESGMPPRLIQELLGHASLTTTMEIYVQWSDDELEAQYHRWMASLGGGRTTEQTP